MLFDTHCHLNDEAFAEDIDGVIERALEAGVEEILVPGVNVKSSIRAIELAERYQGVYAAVGMHPESLAEFDERDLAEIRRLAEHPKVVAIGEIGLDYYWDVAPREEQQRVLSLQMELAEQTGLPVVIHNRESTADVVKILTAFKDRVAGVMHCFTGSYETAVECMRLGYFISFGGPVTFKNAVNVREVARQIPLDRLFVETDSPYLTPHPHRGTRNEPKFVRLVAERLAEEHGVSLESLAHTARDNAHRLFGRMAGGDGHNSAVSG